MHKTIKNLIILFAVAVLISLTVGIVSAAPVTQNITYQGKLTDASGNPLTGSYSVTFRLYDAASSGTTLATDTHSVDASKGLFNTQISADSNLFNGRALWLGITVGGDREMTPRQELRPVPYALSLRPGALITSDAAASPIVTLLNTANDGRGLNVTTTGTEGRGISVFASGMGSDGINSVATNLGGRAFYGYSAGSSGYGAALFTRGESARGVYAQTMGDNSIGLSAETQGRYSPGIVVVTKNTSSTGIFVKTSGDASNGVNVSISGGETVGVNVIATGNLENGVSAVTYGQSSGALNGITYGPASAGLSLYTYGQNSKGLVVMTKNITSHGVDAFTSNQSSHGVNITTSGYSSKGVKILTTNTYSEGVYATTGGNDSPAIYGQTYGNGSYGVKAYSSKTAAIWAETGKTDNKYGVQTPDIIRALGYETGASDVAEYMAVTLDVMPGTVMVIGPDGKLQPSISAYDTGVAGIVSTAPGVSLGAKERGNPGEQLIAVAGRVPCKVDTSNGPIHPRDLLTTSNNPGYAMKATDPKIGSILGKAMGSLESGTGTIEVLVTLQ